MELRDSELKTIAIWWQAFRFHFVPPSYMPAILGSVIAWALTSEFYFWYFLITVIGVTLNHIALNMTDDYFDYKHSVDRLKPGEKNPYSGGSGLLSAGLIEPSKILLAFSLCYLATASIVFFAQYFIRQSLYIFRIED